MAGEEPYVTIFLFILIYLVVGLVVVVLLVWAIYANLPICCYFVCEWAIYANFLAIYANFNFHETRPRVVKRFTRRRLGLKCSASVRVYSVE